MNVKIHFFTSLSKSCPSGNAIHPKDVTCIDCLENDIKEYSILNDEQYIEEVKNQISVLKKLVQFTGDLDNIINE